MAVGKLSGAWILAILRTTYPDGVLRRALLDQFAAELVTPRSSPGSKGRVARRLYGKLAMLQRRGLITQEDGVLRPLAVEGKRVASDALPPLGPRLMRRQFTAYLVEDRGATPAELRAAQWDFLACAIEEGWTVAQAAQALGITPTKATQLITKPAAAWKPK